MPWETFEFSPEIENPWAAKTEVAALTPPTAPILPNMAEVPKNQYTAEEIARIQAQTTAPGKTYKGALSEFPMKPEEMEVKPVAPSQFGLGVNRGLLTAQGLVGGALTQVGESTGLRGVKDAGGVLRDFARSDTAAMPEPRVNSLGQIENLTDFGDWFSTKLGEGLATSAPMIGLGATAGVPGALLGGWGLGVGEVRNELESVGIKDPELLSKYSYIAGSVVGALDSIVPAQFLQSLTGDVKKELGSYLIKRLARASAGGAVTEGITEALQEATTIAAVSAAQGPQAAREMIARGLAGINEQRGRILEAGAAGMVPGSVFGGGGQAAAEVQRVGGEIADEVRERRARPEVLPPELGAPLSFMDLVPQRDGSYGLGPDQEQLAAPQRQLGAPAAPPPSPGAQQSFAMSGDNVVRFGRKNTAPAGPDVPATVQYQLTDPAAITRDHPLVAKKLGPDLAGAQLLTVGGEPKGYVVRNVHKDARGIGYQVLVGYDFAGKSFDPAQYSSEHLDAQMRPLATDEYLHGGTYTPDTPINGVMYLSKSPEYARSYVNMATERGMENAGVQRLSLPLTRAAPPDLVERIAQKVGVETEGVTPASWFDANIHGAKPVNQLISQLRAAGYDHANLMDIPYGMGGSEAEVTVAFPKPGTTARAASTPTGGQSFALNAYHASPYDFDRFDAGKIGTGGGTQNFGRGLYFTESLDLGKKYLNALSNDEGTLYKVSLDVNEDDLLDWDKPYSEQSSKVQEALKKAGVAPQLRVKDHRGFTVARYTDEGLPTEQEFFTFDDPTEAKAAAAANNGRVEEPELGAIFHRIPGGPEGRAELLKSAGIPGVKYGDTGLWGGEQTGIQNYAIFDDGVIKITEKNGKPVTQEQRRAAISEAMSGPLAKAAQFTQRLANQAVGNSTTVDNNAANVNAIIAEHIAAGRTVKFQESFTDRVLNTLRPHLGIVVKGVDVLMLSEIKPHNSELVMAVFKGMDGQKTEVPISFQKLQDSRAFFDHANTNIFFTHFSLTPGFDNSLVGELWHENIHALRLMRAIPAADWAALLSHANSLQVLDLDYRMFSIATKHPNPDKFDPDTSIREVYAEIIKETPLYWEYTASEKQEIYDQEAVAHLMEIVQAKGLRGNPLKAIQPVLDKIANNEYVPGEGARGNARAYATEGPKKIALNWESIPGEQLKQLQVAASPHGINEVYAADKIVTLEGDVFGYFIDTDKGAKFMHSPSGKVVNATKEGFSNLAGIMPNSSIKAIEDTFYGRDRDEDSDNPIAGALAAAMAPGKWEPDIDDLPDAVADMGPEDLMEEEHPLDVANAAKKAKSQALSNKLLSMPPAMLNAVVTWSAEKKAGLEDIQDYIKDGAPIAALVTLGKQLDPFYSAQATFGLNGDKLYMDEIAQLEGVLEPSQFPPTGHSKEILQKLADDLQAITDKYVKKYPSKTEQTAFGPELTEINSTQDFYESSTDLKPYQTFSKDELAFIDKIYKLKFDGVNYGYVVTYKPGINNQFNAMAEFKLDSPEILHISPDMEVGELGWEQLDHLSGKDDVAWAKDAYGQIIEELSAQGGKPSKAKEEVDVNDMVSFSDYDIKDHYDWLKSDFHLKDSKLATTAGGLKIYQDLGALKKVFSNGKYLGAVVIPLNGLEPQFLNAQGDWVPSFAKGDLMGYGLLTYGQTEELKKNLPKLSKGQKSVIAADKLLKAGGNATTEAFAMPLWADKAGVSMELKDKDPAAFWAAVFQAHANDYPGDATQPYLDVIPMLKAGVTKAATITTMEEAEKWIKSIKDWNTKSFFLNLIDGSATGASGNTGAIPHWIKQYAEDLFEFHPVAALVQAAKSHLETSQKVLENPVEDTKNITAAIAQLGSKMGENVEKNIAVLKANKLKEQRLAKLKELTEALEKRLSPLAQQLFKSLQDKKWLSKYAHSIIDPVEKFAVTLASYLDDNGKTLSPNIMKQLRGAVDTLRELPTGEAAASEDQPTIVSLPSYKTVSEGMADLGDSAKNRVAQIIKEVTAAQKDIIATMTAAEMKEHFSGPGWNKLISDAVLEYVKDRNEFSQTTQDLKNFAEGLTRTEERFLTLGELMAQPRSEDPEKRSYTFVGKGSGGSKPKEIWKDQNGNEYMFKPVKAGDEFLAYGEVLGGQISRMVTPEAPEMFVMTLNGRVGSMQRYVTATGTLGELHLGIEDLTPKQISQIQREHVVDWMISNHDGHMNQFLVMPDGGLIGIDKGQAFKYFGKDKLAIDYHPNAVYREHEPIYNTLWKAYSDGKLKAYEQEIQKDERAKLAGMKEVVDAKRMEADTLTQAYLTALKDYEKFQAAMADDLPHEAQMDDDYIATQMSLQNMLENIIEGDKTVVLGPNQYFVKVSGYNSGSANYEYHTVTKDREAVKLFENHADVQVVDYNHLNNPVPPEIVEEFRSMYYGAEPIKLNKWPGSYDEKMYNLTTGIKDRNPSFTHLTVEMEGKPFTIILRHGSSAGIKVMEEEKATQAYQDAIARIPSLTKEIFLAHHNVINLWFQKKYPEAKDVRDAMEDREAAILNDSFVDPRHKGYDIARYQLADKISRLVDSSINFESFKGFQSSSKHALAGIHKYGVDYMVPVGLEKDIADLQPADVPSLKKYKNAQQASSNMSYVLNTLQEQYSEFERQLRNALFGEVSGAITKLQSTLSDSLYAGMLLPYAQSRFKGHELKVQAFLDYALQRKNGLGDKFFHFFVNLDNVRERARTAMKSYDNTEHVSDHHRGLTQKLNEKLMAEDKMYSKMTPPEWKAIHDYTNSAYGNINGPLYGEKAIQKEGEVNLNWLRSAEYAALIMSGLKKMKPYTGTTYRRESLSNSATQLDIFKIGHITDIKAFWSSTYDVKSPDSDVNFVIQSKTGRNVKPLSGHPSENEVLFMPGSRFLCTNFEVDNTGYGKRHIIYLEELEEIDFAQLE